MANVRDSPQPSLDHHVWCNNFNPHGPSMREGCAMCAGLFGEFPDSETLTEVALMAQHFPRNVLVERPRA